MNHHYRIVWNDSTHTWMAVAETARSHGKSQGSRTARSAGAMNSVLRPLAMALALWCGLVHAAPPVSTQLPTGGQVMAGQATISQAAQTAVLNVKQTSDSAVINWNTFNLGSAASVNFAQPGRNAAVLNRVLDANPSQIYGRINAPGQVFFSNPNGMYFAPSASVDVGGLVATTHSISTDDFMAGNYRFTRDGATGAIVNEGQLQAGLSGYVALLAPEVRNQGVVMAHMGTVALAAGESYQLQIQGSRLSQIDVTPATIRTLVENGQAVLAPEGLIVLSAKAAQQLEASVVNTGQLAASSLVERGGRIVLESTGAVTAGGSIQANSAQGQGGRITITGEHIRLPGQSDIQATGATGGGTVLVGGDWQGSNGVPQATSVTMETGARIDASATHNGDGGKVVLWSDVHKAEGQTTVHGSIRARGGAQAGDGGKIETSGHQVDIVGATINAGSDQGAGGLWLLDPYNYTIEAAEALTIKGSLDAGTSFTVETTNASGSGLTGSAGTGVITVNSAISKTAGAAATLTLNAADSIVLNADISSTSGALGVSMNATAGSISGAGNLALNGGTASFNQATTGIYSGVLSGAGTALTKSGLGTLTLTGANSYTGATAINGGTLQIGNNGTTGALGSGAVSVASGATLAFKRTDDLTQNQVITGAGSISQLANSNLTLTHNFNTGYTGDLIINSGQLTLSAPDDNKFLGSAIRINNGSSLGLNTTGGHHSYWIGTNIIFDSQGGGSVKLMHNATNLVVSDSLTFTTNGGAQNRFYSTVGTNWGLNTNNAAVGGVIFNTAAGTNTASADLSIEVPMVNGGVVSKNGAGSVAITADATSGLINWAYNTVTVNAGTYRVGNGGAAGQLGFGAVSVASGATLAFNRSDNVSVTNAITGAGALSKEGSNTLTLPNNPGYSGATHINGGTLVLQNNAPTTSSSGFDGTGILTIQPNGSSFSSAFSTTGWNLGNTLTGLNLGKSGNTSGITVPNAISIAGPINLYGGDLAINAALTATGTNTISLNSSGTVTDGASGALSASNLLLSGGNVTLDSTSNAIGTLAATGVSGLKFVNGAALTLGTVGTTHGVSASGVVDVSTTSGDLTVSQAVSTSNTTANALTLNAGSASAALVETGGNLLVNGSGAVSVGAGGTATLYSGSIGGSTGLAALVGGNGSGRFRYGSDEGTTNYALALGTGLNAIYRQQPTITRAVNDQTITYGDALTNTFSVSDSVNGDTYSQAFGSATTPTVTVGGSTSSSGKYTAGTHTLSATGGATSSQLGYAVASGTTSGTLTVNAKALTLAFTGVNKTYDGALTAAVTSTDDRLAGDVFTVNDSAAFTNKNVGTGKTVNVSSISLSGADAGNYSLAATTATTSADISARTLTVAYSGVNKIYDGNRNATLARTDDRVSGDVLTFSQSALFDDKYVGTNKAVTITGASLGGTDAGNYILASTTGSTHANITPKPLRVYYTAANKVYDGSPSAAVTSSYTSVLGDALTVSQNAEFADKNAGIYKPVYVSGITLGGADASNYALVWDSTIVRADITARPLALGYVALNKNYDGSRAAAVTRTDNRLTGDVFTVSENAEFADKNVGTNKAVSISGISLSGTDAGNYSLASTTASSTADIAAKVLTITGFQVADKNYDGSTNTTVTNWGQVDTGVGNETLLLNHGLALFDNANAGSRTVKASDYSLVNGANGGLSSNYLLSSTDVSTSATIAKAVLQVVANNDAKFVTTNDATGYAGISYSGFVNGETSAVLGSLPGVSRSNASVHTAGEYKGVLVPSGGTSSNYSFSYIPGDYTVVPANQLLVRMVPLSTTYGDAPRYAIASASYFDPIAQQVVTLADTSVSASNVLTVNDGAGGRASFGVTPRNASLSSVQLLRAGVYALGVSGPVTENSQNFSDTITLIGSQTVNAKALAVSTDGVSKVYDGTTSLNGVNFALSAVDGGVGVANGDQVLVTGNGDYANRNAGTQLAYVVNNLSLTGADAGNYYIGTKRSATGSNGTIKPKPLTLTAVTDNKVYDGTTRSGVLPASGALAVGDSLSNLVQTFDSSAVGIRSLSVSGYTLNDGNGGANYVVTRVPGTGSILALQLPPQPVTERTATTKTEVTGTSASAGTTGGATGGATAFSLAAATSEAVLVNCPEGAQLPPTHLRAQKNGISTTEGQTPPLGWTADPVAAQNAVCLRIQATRDVTGEQPVEATKP